MSVGLSSAFKRLPSRAQRLRRMEAIEICSLDCTDAAETRPISLPPELHMIHDRSLNTQEHFYQ